MMSLRIGIWKGMFEEIGEKARPGNERVGNSYVLSEDDKLRNHLETNPGHPPELLGILSPILNTFTLKSRFQGHSKFAYNITNRTGRPNNMVCLFTAQFNNGYQYGRSWMSMEICGRP